MFGNNPREPEDREQFNFPGVNLQSDLPGEIYNDQDTVLQSEPESESESEKSEVVANVEKISRIISPYFIVIIGVALYDSNFLIGLILILAGLLYLFKVSIKDMANVWEWLKDILGFGRD